MLGNTTYINIRMMRESDTSVNLVFFFVKYRSFAARGSVCFTCAQFGKVLLLNLAPLKLSPKREGTRVQSQLV